MRRQLLFGAMLAVPVVLAAACGASGDEPGASGTALPSSVPIGSGAPADGEVIIFRNTLEADAVASTLDHSSTFTFDFDPSVDAVVSVDCAADGSRAVYTLEDVVSLAARVVIAGASGQMEVPIAGNVAGAAMSPDGSRVAVAAYLPDNARSVLFLVDTTTGEVSTAYDRAGTMGAPAWSPDGGSVVFHALSGEQNQLFVYRLGESEAEQVTEVPSGAFSPDWSPGGELIAFSSVTDTGNPQIFTLPAAGGAPSQLTSTQTFKAEPRWSGDGSRLAYVGTILVPTASRLPSRLHNVAVYTSASDGSDEAPFTDLALDAWLLGWCMAGPWLGQGWTEQ